MGKTEAAGVPSSECALGVLGSRLHGEGSLSPVGRRGDTVSAFLRPGDTDVTFGIFDVAPLSVFTVLRVVSVGWLSPKCAVLL